MSDEPRLTSRADSEIPEPGSIVDRVKFQAELAELIGKYGIGKAAGVRDDVLANYFVMDLEALESIKVLERKI